MTNPWISYIDRTYQQIKASILNRMPTLVPEITDFNETNLFIKAIGIWSALMEMIGYYLDNQARETHLTSCRLYSSAVKIARSKDYRVKASRSASATILFTLSAPATAVVNIPFGTILQTAAGRKFYTTAIGTIAIGETAIQLPAEQIEGFVLSVTLGISDGTINQSFEIPDLDVTDQSVSLTVAGLGWVSKETIGYDNGDAHVFVQTVNEAAVPVVMFGDGFNGAVPASGATIVAQYKRCVGATGNVEANTITGLTSTVTLPSGITMTVTNPNRASGGATIETLEELRYRIPRSVRTLLRAVSKQDYIDLLELADGVAKGDVINDCGKYVSGYIVPEGGGVASGGLLASVAGWMDDKKTLCVNLQIKPAGEVRLTLYVTIKVLAGYDPSATATLCANRLVAFGSFQNQRVRGQVQLGDIYEVAETTEGVDYSKVGVMLAIPYARPTGSTTTPLVWTVDVQNPSIATVHWSIQMVSLSTYQLFRANMYIGTFAVSVPVILSEVTLKVDAGGYVIGDSWEFVTYPYYGTLVLDEPAIPVILLSDITIETI
jgi:hypothetical protein